MYTGDAFGLVYPALQRHKRFAIPSTSPTGFHAHEARKSLRKILALGERFVCPTHFDAWDDPAIIAAQVGRFVDRAGAWVEEAAHGEESIAAIEARFVSLWWNAIADEAPSFSNDERALLTSDVEINAKGLAFAASMMRSARIG